MKLLIRSELLAFFFLSEGGKKETFEREWRSEHIYTKLRTFREETEEIELVASLIKFLLLDTCEVRNLSCWIHRLLMSCMPRQPARTVSMLTSKVTLWVSLKICLTPWLTLGHVKTRAWNLG